MTTQFNMGRDINGYNAFAPTFSDTSFSTTLASNVTQVFGVPDTSENWIAIFSFDPGTRVWVSNAGAASVPGSTFAATFSQLNPAARWVLGGSSLNFITSDTTSAVSISLYAI